LNAPNFFFKRGDHDIADLTFKLASNITSILKGRYIYSTGCLWDPKTWSIVFNFGSNGEILPLFSNRYFLVGQGLFGYSVKHKKYDLSFRFGLQHYANLAEHNGKNITLSLDPYKINPPLQEEAVERILDQTRSFIQAVLWTCIDTDPDLFSACQQRNTQFSLEWSALSPQSFTLLKQLLEALLETPNPILSLHPLRESISVLPITQQEEKETGEEKNFSLIKYSGKFFKPADEAVPFRVEALDSGVIGCKI
jgi:hypothetical protein